MTDSPVNEGFRRLCEAVQSIPPAADQMAQALAAFWQQWPDARFELREGADFWELEEGYFEQFRGDEPESEA